MCSFHQKGEKSGPNAAYAARTNKKLKTNTGLIKVYCDGFQVVHSRKESKRAVLSSSSTLSTYNELGALTTESVEITDTAENAVF